MNDDAFDSPAWLLEGLTGSSEPGWLALKNGRLTFVLDAGVVFDIEPARLETVAFPWYYFSGGMKLRAAGKEYRLSFVRPNGAEVAAGRVLANAGSPLALYVAASKVQDITTGRAAGKRWRELLGHA